MVVLRMDRLILEDVICKHYHLQSIENTCRAPGQILGGLLTILLMASRHHILAPQFAFYQCSISEHRC